MSAVPCNGCRACCREQLVLIMPEDEPNSAAYQCDEFEVKGRTFRTLKFKPNGDCIHLGDTGCTIYEQRPMVCKEYDCRKQFLIMSRGERRQFKNQAIWREARARIASLDTEDRAEIIAYATRASKGYRQIAETGSVPARAARKAQVAA